MGFFDDVPDPEIELEERFRPPDWAGPPANIVGGTVPLDVVLVNTGDIAMVLGNFTAYPTGVEFDLHLLWRQLGDQDQRDLFMAMHRPRREGFRFGVELADGRRTFADHGPSDDGPRLTQQGGGGSPLHYRSGFWLWPLPPDGPLRFACQWPEQRIPESAVEVDAGVMREAATRAIELWPDERPVDDDDEW